MNHYCSEIRYLVQSVDKYWRYSTVGLKFEQTTVNLDPHLTTQVTYEVQTPKH